MDFRLKFYMVEKYSQRVMWKDQEQFSYCGRSWLALIG